MAVNTPGFQGSETSGMELVIYARGLDPVLINATAGRLPATGRGGPLEVYPALTSCSMGKRLGAAGTFSAALKSGRNAPVEFLLERLTDDDWVDVFGYRHGRRWHLMRATIDEIFKEENATDSGATVVNWRLSGRDFQKCFELTPLWFDRFAGDEWAGAISFFIMSGQNHANPPNETVENILRGFMSELASRGRANWSAPPAVPNFSGNLIENIVYDDSGYTNTPPRIAVSANFAEPRGTAWSLAQEWADLMFCELYTELLPDGQAAYSITDTWDETRTKMTVVFRDKPFPTLAGGRNSPWFSLPTIEVPRQALKSLAISRGGHERYNAFYVSPQMTQEQLGLGKIEIDTGLASEIDILTHGFRRFDISTHYSTPNADLLSLIRDQRLTIRDWYAINPYLRSGSATLGYAAFESRVGTRFRIAGYNGPEEQETYYVEGIDHVWSGLEAGAKTTLTLTRGFRGTDADYLTALNNLASTYRERSVAT